MPPSLRFYAGGDRSIRGYEWREVGPRIGDFPIGAKHEVTPSVEFERHFTQSWGGAVFVDSRSAFNGPEADWHTGVGVGVRWQCQAARLAFYIHRAPSHPAPPGTRAPTHGRGEVGPRIVDFSIGGKNVVTTSVEFERYFTQSWGGAVFVDSGSAFNGTEADWHTGVGVGVRWKSPVGPLRFDIARGLDHPDSPFTIGLSIGAEF